MNAMTELLTRADCCTLEELIAALTQAATDAGDHPSTVYVHLNGADRVLVELVQITLGDRSKVRDIILRASPVAP